MSQVRYKAERIILATGKESERVISFFTASTQKMAFFHTIIYDQRDINTWSYEHRAENLEDIAENLYLQFKNTAKVFRDLNSFII